MKKYKLILLIFVLMTTFLMSFKLEVYAENAEDISIEESEIIENTDVLSNEQYHEGDAVKNIVKSIESNGFIVILEIAIIISIIFIYEKESINILIRLLLECIIVYFIFKLVYCGKNFIVLSLLASLLITLINAVLSFKFTKKTLTIFISQIVENIIFLIFGIIFIKLNRRLNIFEELNDTYLKIIFSSIILVASFICLKNNLYVINKSDEMKVKTKDIKFNELFDKTFRIGKEHLKNELSSIIVGYVALMVTSIIFINNIYLDTKINDEMNIEIAIVSAICILENIVSIFISACVYSKINGKKEIYKKVSENKMEGNSRSLKI